ncbi:MAG: molybdopterin-synthase adenylyltransferase MoeB [Sinobacterium sp.]|nr:molybdopterin-synthase adenylyltransferase MoeB [Sinobacterium sp.]
MNDHQLLRYSRQIMLPQVDIEGQQKLLNATVLIIGAGGLGSPAALYLTAAGIGNITLYDDDAVDLSNLQRQITHYTADIGTDKVISTKSCLNLLNPETKVDAIKQRLAGQALITAVKKADIVLDCSDNFKTRFEINYACVQQKTPLVSGAAIRFEGQVAVFLNQKQNAACYNCLYQQAGETTETCVTHGILAPITGIIGCIQALEAMKVIMAIGEVLEDRLLLLDGLRMEWQTIRLKKNPQCPSCRPH